MKVLLTGASGFVGSHILDSLRARGIPVGILLRKTSNRRFIEPHLSSVKIFPGSINEPESLRPALDGVTHVIHCAGCVKASRRSEFFAINQTGTRNVVEAINATPGVQRLVHISSLAAAGPAPAAHPARETDPTHPVSDYGRSKLAAEQEVRDHCRAEFVIVRPPAVYGPRDAEFLRLFKAVRNHVMPRPSGTQALSLVYVQDLAEAVVTCLEHPAAAGKLFFASNKQIVTAPELAAEIARQMKTWTVPLPLPNAVMWLLCLSCETMSRVSGKANVLSLQKFSELRAPGWVCDPARLRSELGFQCNTSLATGIAQTLKWYRDQKWI